MKLYRYRVGNEDDLDDLENHKLWLTNPLFFNDPYDCAIQFGIDGRIALGIQEHLRNLGFAITDKQNDKYIEQKIIEEVKKQVKCKAVDKFDELVNGLNPILKSLIKQTGVACFFPRNDSIPMWSYYANYHQGICVEYEVDDLKKIGWLGPIYYCNDLNRLYVKMSSIAAGDKSKSYKRIYDFILTYVMTKSEDWHHENEWRLVLFNLSIPDDKEGTLIDFPNPSAIYVGCKSNKNPLIARIKQSAINKGIPLFEMYAKKDEFKLIPKKI